MGDKNNKEKIIKILLTVVFAILVLQMIVSIRRNRLYDRIDNAREAYRTEIKDLQVYQTKEGDCVQKVSVAALFDDRDLSSILFRTNRDRVWITMDDSFESLSMRERCSICVKIMEEIRPILNDNYKNSEYYQLFSKHAEHEMMRYRGKSLDPKHQVEFIFSTNDYQYTFPTYTSMTVTLTGTDSRRFYTFYEKNGKLVDFGERYKANNKKAPVQTEKSSVPSTGNNNLKKYSDPYDVDKYNSAQEFADDKYEEFLDYEDDYEDEDEAYDAAEDYWREHH